MNWSNLPDIAAVGLLVCAFASMARRTPTPVSGMWLTGWMMILLHFLSSFARLAPGVWEALASVLTLSSLVWAGVLFQSAVLPFGSKHSSPWMRAILLTTNTLYISLPHFDRLPAWTLDVAALSLGLGPLLVMLIFLRRFNHPLRQITVLLYCSLSLFLLFVQHRPNGADIAVNAVLFTVYAGCCINFSYVYRRATAGAFVTIAGFFTWANVFTVAPLMGYFLPAAHVESEVWNLPKYLVAVGMILLLLEEQIAHNKYLALHDELTGLANRRLFQDRLATALERARRSGNRTALLLIDLDHFKNVNDSFGHHIGDLLLESVSKAFAGRVRRSDTVARTGGDEFAVILEEPVSRLDAEQVGCSLLQLLSKPIELEGHSVSVGASIGVALFPDDAMDVESLRIAADMAMYERKYASRATEEHHGPAAPRSLRAPQLINGAHTG